MRLKPIKNFDKEVHLPKELEFRQETVWNKIQSKKERSPSKAIIYWSGAASVAFLLGLFLFGTKKETQIDDSRLVTGRSTKEVIFETKIERPQILNLDKTPIQVEGEQKPSSKRVLGNLEILTEKPPLNYSTRKVTPVTKFLINEPEVIEEKPKELSPAALHLQKSLARLNKDKSAEQVLLVEKFNLLNDLNIGKVQASTNTSPNSVFHSIKKDSNERN